MFTSTRSVLAAVIVIAVAVAVAVAAFAAFSMTVESKDEPHGQFDWENRTGGPLLHDGAWVQNGGGQGIPVDNCSETPFLVQDREGRVVAELGEWCDGQRWVVRGPGDADVKLARTR